MSEPSRGDASDIDGQSGNRGRNFFANKLCRTASGHCYVVATEEVLIASLFFRKGEGFAPAVPVGTTMTISNASSVERR
jgi:hypothetical protein